MKGCWDLDKKPVVYEYRADLRCGICNLTKVVTFRAEMEAQGLPGDYPGTWARVGFVGGHADPLGERSNIVVCSRPCGEKAAIEYLDSIW